MRHRFRPRVAPRQPHRVNSRVTFPRVEVISAEGKPLGTMSPEDGRRIAQDAGLDLVEVAPDARPPVCKIIDYGKFKYQQSRRKKNSQSSSSVKTIQLRPNTDDHDLNTKLSHARRFLQRGDKVRMVMRLRGRELAFMSRAANLLVSRTQEGLEGVGSVVSRPAPRGRQISLMVEPVRR